jgi:hypothetical protein
MNHYYDCEVLADKYEEMEELIKASNAMDTETYVYPTDEMMVGRNKVIEQINTGEFQTYNICNVMDWVYSTFGVNPYSMSYEWECDRLKEFCNNFNLYLYEKPREDFFEWEGVEEAYKGGHKGVILSDLS